MKTKICRNCGIEKPLNAFHRSKAFKNGFLAQCKKCRLEYKKEYDSKNKEKAKAYYKDNKEKIDARNKIYYENNKEKVRKYWSRWNKNRRLNDVGYRLNRNMKSMIKQSLKGNKNGHHWEDLINYTQEDLRKHLEGQFKDGMNWENYGKWHIDHRIPISLFNIKGVKSKAFKICWSLENLQPLWAKDNRKKKNKLFA